MQALDAFKHTVSVSPATDAVLSGAAAGRGPRHMRRHSAVFQKLGKPRSAATLYSCLACWLRLRPTLAAHSIHQNHGAACTLFCCTRNRLGVQPGVGAAQVTVQTEKIWRVLHLWDEQ